MNAKKVKPFLFVPLQPWRRRSDHNRNLGFPVAQHHTRSRGRRRHRGGSHAGGACPADMGGRRIAATAASPHLLALAVVALAASGERGSERRGERGGRRRAAAAAPPRPYAPCTVTMVAWIERGRERERAERRRASGSGRATEGVVACGRGL